LLFLIVFLILLALVLILLCLPLEIELLAQFREHSSLRLRFRNFFCRISWEAGKERKCGREAEKKPGVDYLGRLEKAFDVIQISGLWERLWLLLKRLFRVVKVISIDTDLRVSLGDDYYTGILCGLLLPVVLILNQQDNNDIKLQPAFEEDLILQGYLKTRAQVRPVEAALPCIAFIFSPAAWSAGQKLIGKRWKRKY
jgi:hypothetical protein